MSVQTSAWVYSAARPSALDDIGQVCQNPSATVISASDETVVDADIHDFSAITTNAPEISIAVFQVESIIDADNRDYAITTSDCISVNSGDPATQLDTQAAINYFGKLGMEAEGPALCLNIPQLTQRNYVQCALTNFGHISASRGATRTLPDSVGQIVDIYGGPRQIIRDGERMIP